VRGLKYNMKYKVWQHGESQTGFGELATDKVWSIKVRKCGAWQATGRF
jgi:hypothetical protein